MSLKLWDEQQQKMVGFKHLKIVRARNTA
jgi:hypothetical protein